MESLIVASAGVAAQVGFAFPTNVNRASGVTNVVRNGAGDYTLTLAADNAADAAGSQVLLTVENAAVAASAIERPSDTTIRVRTSTDAGVATDMPFCVALLRLPGPSY